MTKNLIRFYSAIILLLSCNNSFSQTHEINRLESGLSAVKDSIKYVDVLNRIAMLSHMNYRDSCLFYALKAKRIAVRLNYMKGIADATNCQGIYYVSINNYLSAKYLNDALQIYKSIGDQENICQVLMNISVVLFVDKNKKEALKYIHQSYEKSSSLKKDSIRSIIFCNLSYIDPNLSRDQYKLLLKKGKAIAEKYKDEAMTITYEGLRGVDVYKAGEKQRGLDIEMRALHMADSLAIKQVVISIYDPLAMMMIDMGEVEKGVAYYKKGLDISQKYGHPEFYLIYAERLYDFYKSRNQQDLAYHYLSLLFTKREAIIEATNRSGYNYMNFALNENENEQLKNKDSSRIKTIILLGCLFVLSITLLFFIYRSLRIKRRYGEAQRQLHETALKQNMELQQSNHFNTMLISVIAHDIRQPFSTIMMLSNIFNTDVDLLSEQEKFNIMGELNETSRNSLSFMDGLLEWIKSQKTEYEYQPAKLMLKKLISEANSFFRIAQAKKNIELVLDISEQTAIFAHKQMLLFIVRNILNNATKFSPLHGIIHISTYLSDQDLVIAIKDQGPGMSQEKVDRLFKVNSSDLENTKNQGAGLALSISYEMSLMMGVKIWVTSKKGEGSVFYVSIKK